MEHLRAKLQLSSYLQYAVPSIPINLPINYAVNINFDFPMGKSQNSDVLDCSSWTKSKFENPRKVDRENAMEHLHAKFQLSSSLQYAIGTMQRSISIFP